MTQPKPFEERAREAAEEQVKALHFGDSFPKAEQELLQAVTRSQFMKGAQFGRRDALEEAANLMCPDPHCHPDFCGAQAIRALMGEEGE